MASAVMPLITLSSFHAWPQAVQQGLAAQAVSTGASAGSLPQAELQQAATTLSQALEAFKESQNQGNM